MKKFALLVLAFSSVLLSVGQSKSTAKKYPSLFWEITGNGLSRPSYLFGTMHVSSKLVFHLPDSFYTAIKNVDVVALETNPESWQEDLVKYDIEGNSSSGKLPYAWNDFRPAPDDYLHFQTLQFDKYEKQLEAALYSRPSTINNLLYRNYSDYSSDFEENTFLDMYIYQVGKKMGKRVAGVEKYDESMKLMMEAYRDAAKDKNHKQRSYDNDEAYSADKLQDAYRMGNLDLLDSINRMNSFSDAFDEKFLYSRNWLQANSIDSILRTRSSLFVGVGAAHLPGSRGVIEILRKKGYRLRPIVSGERDGNEKDLIEKLRVPVHFTTQSSDDGFIKVDIPGRFYRFNEEGPLDQLQYADMANGSYYMVTRIKTNSRIRGQNDETVKRKIDSLLYENIPGKILSRQEILRNGYTGIDILNRTRRGDVQRYNIFITPFEVIIFKMSGNGDYVKDGDEAQRFFSSIRLKEQAPNQWTTYEPACGGFSADLPGEPFVSKNVNWQYEAEDRSTGTDYTILRTDIHNYGFAEEDSFDLNLLDESFSHSDFIDKELNRQFIICHGYPALDCRYRHKDGSVLFARFIIQGPHYYTLIAHSRKENAGIQGFLNSFQPRPLRYNEPVRKDDTTLYYRVTTTFYPQDKKIKLIIPDDDNSYTTDEEEDEPKFTHRGNFGNKVIENDSTGEKIYISFHRDGPYYYTSDSTDWGKNKILKNSSWIVRSRKQYKNPGNWLVTDLRLSDTNSSRLIWTKSFYRDGNSFFLATEGDTVTAPSSFVETFFETFTPSDSLKGANPFEKKSALFFRDFFSSDTLLHARAVKSVDDIKLDSTDLPGLEKAISSVNWSHRKYIETKESLVEKLGDIGTRPAADYLKRLYFDAADTVELQYAALTSLLQQQTSYAFSVFRDIMTAEPPVMESNSANATSDLNSYHYNFNLSRIFEKDENDDNDFWNELYDSVQLTRTILADILPLVNLDDYKWKTMRLLATMIDSNCVKADDYSIYFTKFFIEARQELKKQAINEKKKLIEKASGKHSDAEDEDDDATDAGNRKLELYAKLLLPFWKTDENISPLFQKLLQLNDRKVKYNILLLLVRNKKPVPDSLFNYFAAMDDYRYDLYNDLSDMGQLKYFPGKYNNQLDLAKSKLLDSKSYSKPDSVVFVNKLPAEYKSRQGYIYFFKYKEKKDDPVWKLATVGLLSREPGQFEITIKPASAFDGMDEDDNDNGDFTSFTDSKLRTDEPLPQQLNDELKRLLYSTRKSAKEFYEAPQADPDLVTALRAKN